MPTALQSSVHSTTGAVPSVKQAHSMGTIEDRIRHDHREIFAWYDKYKSCATTNRNEAEKWKNMLIYEVTRHSAAEEIVLYPAFEKNIKGTGKAMADEARREHDQVKKDLYVVDAQKIKDVVEYDAILRKVIEELRVHVQKEEEIEIPALVSAISAEEALEMGRRFQTAKLLAPTHPHTTAPSDGGLGEQAMGLLVKPLDKLRDALRNFPTEDECNRALSDYMSRS